MWIWDNIQIVPFSQAFVPVTKKKVITHILVTTKDVNGYFQKNSILLIEQITVVEKKQIISKVGHIPRDSEVMKKVNCLIKKQLGVD